MNQRGSLVPVVTIIFAVAALALSGWFFVTVQTKVKHRSNVNSSGTQNTNTVANPTAGWNTYTNATWGFSFKYPGDWAVETDNLQPKGQAGETDNVVKVGKADRPYLVFTVDQKQTPSVNVYKVFSITKSGNTFVVSNGVATGAKPGEFSLTEFYSVRAHEAEKTASPSFYLDFQTDVKSTDDSASDELFRQILTSFSLTTSTAGWKTFESSALGISLKLPSDWTVTVPADASWKIVVASPTCTTPKFVVSSKADISSQAPLKPTTVGSRTVYAAADADIVGANCDGIFSTWSAIEASFAELTTSSPGPRVVLKDAQTGLPLKRAPVSLYSDNGVRCVTVPCITNGRSWNGTTDDQGVIMLPGDMVDASMSFTVSGYVGKELNTGGQKQDDGSWILSLEPKSKSDQSNTSPGFCTLDVLPCADGSYVTRQPPTCEFAKCPSGSEPRALPTY